MLRDWFPDLPSQPRTMNPCDLARFIETTKQVSHSELEQLLEEDAKADVDEHVTVSFAKVFDCPMLSEPRFGGGFEAFQETGILEALSLLKTDGRIERERLKAKSWKETDRLRTLKHLNVFGYLEEEDVLPRLEALVKGRCQIWDTPFHVPFDLGYWDDCCQVTVFNLTQRKIYVLTQTVADP
jgi:hypothetical protein